MGRAEFLAAAAKGKALDAGFNPDDFSLHEKLVKKLGKKNVIGFDVIVKKPEKNIAKASAEKLPFRANSFDSVIAGELIEHLRKPQEFLQECGRVLKKEGTLALSTPNKKSWLNRLAHSYEAPLHFSLFSLPELEALLRKNSFSVVSLKMFPYTLESSEGSRHKWFMPVRKLLHYLMPNSFRENIALVAVKK